MKSDIFDLQTRLVAAAGPSGFEEESGKLVTGLAKPYCDEVYTDAMNNVIAHKKGSGKRLMFSAHRDTIGFMATGVGKDGSVSLQAIGGIRAAWLHGTPVRFLNGPEGSLFIRSRRSMMEKKPGDIRVQDLYADIGASEEAQAKELVSPGSVCVFAGSPRRLAGTMCSSPYLDDLIACAALLEAMKRVGDSPNDLYFVFSCQEEVGLRGALTAAYGIEPDAGFACDIFPSTDCPSAPPDTGDSKLGAGPGLMMMDGSMIAAPWLIRKLRETAAGAGIPFQMAALAAGGTDAGAIQKAHAGVPVAGIGIPIRYTHSPIETCDEQDVENAVRLIAAAAVRELF